MAYLDTWSVIQALPAKWVPFSETEKYYYSSTLIAGDGIWYACLINQIFGVDNLPFYRSDDAGSNWSEVSGIYSIFDCCASADGSIVYATDLYLFKIYKSTDNGITFSDIYTSGTFVSGLCCSDDGATVYAINGGARTVIKSTNGGTSWSTVLTLTAPDGVRDINCSADGAKVVIPGDLNKLYISTNGGSTWSSTPPSAGGTYVRWAGVISRDGSVIYAGGTKEMDNATTSYIFKSTDDGATWSTSYAVSNYWRSFACTADGTKILALEDQGFYTSDDSGASWSSVWVQPDGNGPVGKAWQFDGNATRCLSQDGSLAFVGGYGPKGPWRSPSTLMVISITPDNGTYLGGTPVTILGGSFMPDAIATIDGNELVDAVVVDEGMITGLTPPGIVGPRDVSVTNP